MQKQDGVWRITDVTLAETAASAVAYENTRYGFVFSLPEKLAGLFGRRRTVDRHAPNAGRRRRVGRAGSDSAPGLDGGQPRQDIPIMCVHQGAVGTGAKRALSVGAAPFGPSRLGENSSTSSALPARYNYAFPTGFEEVADILGDSRCAD